MANMKNTWTLAALYLACLGPQATVALTQKYCSSENTGSDYDADSYTYQSNGYCYDLCTDYAFGIVQGKVCWCSNVAPGDTVDVSECSTDCPGYPQESCGNTDEDLYGYITISGNTPSSTAAGSSSTTSSTSSSSSSSTTTQEPVTETVVRSKVRTVTLAPETTTTSPSPASSKTSASATSTSTSTSTTSSASSTTSTSTLVTSTSSQGSGPSSSASVYTQPGGSVITSYVLVTPTAAPVTTADSSSKGLQGGAIAGVVVGSIAGALLLASALFWLFFYRRRRSNPNEPDDEKFPQRSWSQRLMLNRRETDETPGYQSSILRTPTTRTNSNLFMGEANEGNNRRWTANADLADNESVLEYKGTYTSFGHRGEGALAVTNPDNDAGSDRDSIRVVDRH